jgi:hypothetical protein
VDMVVAVGDNRMRNRKCLGLCNMLIRTLRLGLVFIRIRPRLCLSLHRLMAISDEQRRGRKLGVEGEKGNWRL